ncbi:MAG: ParB/RepB/Spo0J family partition protein [Chloroflexi bacterium]|nr:ParB/RepB/Spo0J family partition protein [Chloroflexota bacterium]MBV9601501.1 ParB/RepB/Spo0J family partition protein [Chloroflexota bacterium]
MRPRDRARLPELRYVPLAAIDVPRRPVRRALGDISGLAESMDDYGLQQPISVRVVGDRYRLTSGLRRLEAARMLHWQQVLAFVRSVDADQAYLLDLIENLQREDLSAEEEADALGELVRTRGWTLQQVADAIKRSVTYVSRRVRIFEDPELREAISQRGLPVSTAEVLLAAEPELRSDLIRRSLDEGWDQAHARVAVRALDTATALEVESDEQSEYRDSDAEATGHSREMRARQPQQTAGGDSRPPGFTRSVREFHRVIMIVRPEDLSGADRAALRALFRDLVLLARASTTPGPRVFPPLPGGRR